MLQQPAVAAVIIGCRLGQSSHAQENNRALAFCLSMESMAAIDYFLRQPVDGGVGKGYVGMPPGDCGDEYRHPPYLTASGDLSHHLSTMPHSLSTEVSMVLGSIAVRCFAPLSMCLVL